MNFLDPVLFIRRLLIPLLLGLAALVALTNYARHPWRVRLLYFLRLGVVVSILVLTITPSLSWETKQTTQPEIILAVDGSQSMSLTDEKETGRIERARKIARDLVTAYGQTFRVRTYKFGSTAEPVDDLDEIQPKSPLTDLTGALRTLTTADPERVRAVFLLSDGRSSSRDKPHMWAKTSEVPIYAIGIGRESYSYRDFSIHGVEAPDFAYKDSLVTIAVEVRAQGPAAAERLPVSLKKVTDTEARVVEEKPVDLKDGKGRVEFSFKPTEAGLSMYRVSIPEAEGELSYRNNQKDVVFLVEQDARRLVLLSGRPTWETAFLRRSIEKDPRFELTSHELVTPDQKHTFKKEDLTRAQLVMLNHFRSQDFSEEQIQALEQFVSRGQGALWVIGLEPKLTDELLASRLGPLLPVDKLPGQWSADRRMHMALSPLGGQHPVMQVTRHSQANVLAWKNLPPIAPGAGLVARDNTHVLASFSFYPDDLVAIGYRYSGTGLVAVTNTFELHLLKLLPAAARDDERVFERFVSNLLDWMTDRSSMTGVTLNLGKSRYVQGENVQVEVNDYLGRLSDKEVQIEIQSLGTTAAPRKLALIRDQDSIGGQFEIEDPGVYEVRLDVPGHGMVRRHIFIDAESWELSNPFADFNLMRQIGSLSGGSFFGEADGEWTRLPIDASPIVKVNRSNLYWADEWRLLTLILVLLTLEWALRRRLNLI